MKITKKISWAEAIDENGSPYARCWWKIKVTTGVYNEQEHRIDGPAFKDTSGDMAWYYYGRQLHIAPDKVSIGDVVIFGYGPVLVMKHLEGLVYEVMRGDHKFKIMFEQKKYIETMARSGHDYYEEY